MLDPKYLRAQSTSSQAPDTVITKWGSVTVTRDCIQTQFQDDAVQRLLTQHTYRSWGAPGTGSDTKQTTRRGGMMVGRPLHHNGARRTTRRGGMRVGGVYESRWTAARQALRFHSNPT